MSDASRPVVVTHRFVLYVAGRESKSVQAEANLRHLCEERLAGQYEIAIVDVLVDYRAALEANVLLTPAVKLIEPLPPVTLFGTLADRDRVAPALRMGAKK